MVNSKKKLNKFKISNNNKSNNSNNNNKNRKVY